MALPLTRYSPSPGLWDELENIDTFLDVRGTIALFEKLQCYQHLFTSLERFHPEVYQRNRIFRSEFIDLLLLCWRPGQRTPIHDHTGSTCGVQVLRGKGLEVNFTTSPVHLLVPNQCHELHAGSSTFCQDDDVHMLGNYSTHEDLVTLHCYSPPLSNMKIYSQSESFLAGYDALTEKSLQSGCYEIPSAELYC